MFLTTVANIEHYVWVLVGKQTKRLVCPATCERCYLFIEAKNANVAVDLHVNDGPCPSEGLMEDKWCLSASLSRRPGRRLITFFLKVLSISIDHHCCYIN